jgi:hypothetical protein
MYIMMAELIFIIISRTGERVQPSCQEGDYALQSLPNIVPAHGPKLYPKGTRKGRDEDFACRHFYRKTRHKACGRSRLRACFYKLVPTWYVRVCCITASLSPTRRKGLSAQG